jgi:lipopolysaccharide export system protein LptA
MTLPVATHGFWLGSLAAGALLIASWCPAAAQSQPPSPPANPAQTGTGTGSGSGGFDFGGGSQPIEISADNGIEWSRDAKTYVARGSAVASQGNSEIHAQTLTAYYSASSSQIDRMLAEGEVKIMNPTETAYGDRADYDHIRKLLVMTGAALRIESASQTVTARDSFEYWQDQDVMVAHGNVRIVKRNGTTIDGDQVTSYFRKNADTGKREAFQVLAEGHVRIDTGKEVATCNHAVYDPTTQIAVLTGHVVLTQNRSVFQGERAEIDTNKGISRLLPAPGQRVHTIIQPKQNASPAGTTNSAAPLPTVSSTGDSSGAVALPPNTAVVAGQ